MVVTPTRINLGPSPVNYLAEEKVEGFPGVVSAIASSIPGAIAACALKKEAHDVALERRHAIQISAECARA